jgi:predicted DNA-binding transcriptional regulator
MDTRLLNASSAIEGLAELLVATQRFYSKSHTDYNVLIFQENGCRISEFIWQLSILWQNACAK